MGTALRPDIPRVAADASRAVPPRRTDIQRLQVQIREALAAGYSRAEVSDALKAQRGLTLEEFERQTAVTPLNVGRAGAMGATLGLLDELIGGMAAAGNPGAPPPVGAGTPSQRYRAARDEVRQPYEVFRGAHPTISATAEMGGGLLLPLGAATPAARGAASVTQGAIRGVARGAGVGGATGLLAGLGYAPDLSGQSLANALLSGGVGLGLGAVTGGLAGAIAAPRANLGAQRLQTVVSSEPPMALQGALSRRLAAGREEPPLAVLSPRLIAESEYAVTASPEVRTAVRPTMLARQAGQSERILADVQDLVGGLDANMTVPTAIRRGTMAPRGVTPSPVPPTPPSRGLDATTRLEELKAARRAWADPQYEALGETMVADPRVEAFVSRPIIRGVYSRAVQEGAAAGVLEGTPSFRQLNALRQNLSDEAEAAFRAGRNERGVQLRSAATELDDLLETTVPGFREVQEGYRTLSQPIRALEQGVEWFQKADRRELQRYLGTLNADELSEWRRGLASELIRNLQSRKTNVDVASQLLAASPDMQAKLEMLFGKDYATFVGRLQLEQIERELYAGTLGSPTARRTQQMEVDPIEVVRAARSPLWASGMLLRHIRSTPQQQAQRTAGEMAPYLFRPVTSDVALDRLLQEIARAAQRGQPLPIIRAGLPLAGGLLAGRTSLQGP